MGDEEAAGVTMAKQPGRRRTVPDVEAGPATKASPSGRPCYSTQPARVQGLPFWSYPRNSPASAHTQRRKQEMPTILNNQSVDYSVLLYRSDYLANNGILIIVTTTMGFSSGYIPRVAMYLATYPESNPFFVENLRTIQPRYLVFDIQETTEAPSACRAWVTIGNQFSLGAVDF